MTETILLCEESPEGIFTGVYTAYELKLSPNHTHLQLGGIDNYQLFARYKEVAADAEKAFKVEKSLRKRLGDEAMESVWYAMSSYDLRKGDAVYHTIARGMAGAFRGQLMDYLQDPYVNLTAKLRLNVWHEAHRFMGFVRFAQLESGILYSEIEPKNDVLPFLGEHFSDRLPQENFMIRDKGRELYLIHRANQGYFLFKDPNGQWGGQESSSALHYSHNEEQLQKLFRCFVDSISIKERENKSLQRQMLPLRFRPNMVEFD